MMRYIRHFNSISKERDDIRPGILESTSQSEESLYGKLLGLSIDSIFGNSASMLVLTHDVENPENHADFEWENDGITKTSSTHNFEFICVDPSLCEEIKKMGEPTRISLSFTIESEFNYSLSRYSYDDESELVIKSVEHTIDPLDGDIWFSFGEGEPDDFDYSPYIDKISENLDENDQYFSDIESMHPKYIAK